MLNLQITVILYKDLGTIWASMILKF